MINLLLILALAVHIPYYGVKLTWSLPPGQCAPGDQINPCYFKIQRSIHGLNRWDWIGTTKANATSVLDSSAKLRTGGTWDYRLLTMWTPPGKTVPMISDPSNVFTVVVPTN